jgi:hypothetical protein
MGENFNCMFPGNANFFHSRPSSEYFYVMAHAYRVDGMRRYCNMEGCTVSFNYKISTVKLKAHTSTHRNQALLRDAVRANSNATLNEQLASIIARLKLPPMIVDRPEFRIELFNLIRTTTRPCPYRHTIASNTLKVAAKYKDRIIKRLVEWNEPVTVAMDGNT